MIKVMSAAWHFINKKQGNSYRYSHVIKGGNGSMAADTDVAGVAMIDVATRQTQRVVGRPELGPSAVSLFTHDGQYVLVATIHALYQVRMTKVLSIFINRNR